MPKYIFIYHGGADMTPPATDAERAEAMTKWKAWGEEMGSSLVDFGNPAGKSKTVFADRVEDNGGANPIFGYTLVNASDMDAAIAMAKGCPMLAHGGNVEVAQAMEIDM